MKIKVHYWAPPIPLRSFDFCAYEEGKEDEGCYGWGASRQEAIDDLRERIEIEEPISE